MTITNTWGVVQMECYPEYEGQPDMVFNVHWSLTAREDNYVGYAYGSVSVPLADEENFTPYEDLTEEQVLQWVKDALGEEAVLRYEQIVAQEIETQKNPPVVRPPLPWSQPPAQP